MNRREALKIGGLALGGAAVSRANPYGVAMPPPNTRRLFFELRDLPRIRANARTLLLGQTFREWQSTGLDTMAKGWHDFRESGDIVFDLRQVWLGFTQSTTVQLIEPTRKRETALLDTIREVIELDKWDYFLDGDEVLGIMRSSMAISRLLFAREVLGDAIDPELDARLLDAIAEKGIVPCHRTVYDMDHPDQVEGWAFDPKQRPYHEIDMRRWPLILGSNNLRAIPTFAMGLGALALEGRDARAAEWLELAESSSRKVFGLFSRDGSFFEGLSYAGYTLRTLLQFCNAHLKQKGHIDWTREMNWEGFLEFVATMQAGKYPDGTPDIVNFSDARTSLYPCVSSWIEEHTGNPAAQYVAEKYSVPGYFMDYLWFRPNRPMRNLPVSLENHLNDLDWVLCRSGWGKADAVLAFRSGYPANHEHADRNSFFFKIYEERLLNDHFGAAYDRLHPGWSLRLTKGHNVVLVDGKGQQYHEGEEGVNEGLSIARVVRFEDEGQKVWWSSDAAHGYRLVNPNVRRVMRTVAFAKPDVIVVWDEVDLERDPAEVEVRYYPDNRDGEAGLSLDGGTFRIQRPKAELFGLAAGRAGVGLEVDLLDPTEDPPPASAGTSKQAGDHLWEFGEYPYVGVASAGKAMQHSIVTVLVARPGTENLRPAATVEATPQGWYFRVADVDGYLVRDGADSSVLW